MTGGGRRGGGFKNPKKTAQRTMQTLLNIEWVTNH